MENTTQTQTGRYTRQERCHYCGKRPREPFRVSGFYASGADFVGHKTCYREMRAPEDPRFGHERHDIKVRR